MSDQAADQAYPYTPNVYLPPTTHSSSHSNGSFAPVLIVLAIIFVLTIIAVVVGRCGYRKDGVNKAGKSGRGKKKGKGGVPAGRLNDGGKFHQGDDGDIEFGFGKRVPTAKVANDNIGFEGRGPMMMPQRSDPRGPRMPPSGGGRGHVRFGDHNEVINPQQFHEGS